MRGFKRKLRVFFSKLPDRMLRAGLIVLGILALFAAFDIETLKKFELWGISDIANTIDNLFPSLCSIFKNKAIKIIIWALWGLVISLCVSKFIMRPKAVVVKHSTFSNAQSTYDGSNLSGYSVKEIDINLVDQMHHLDIVDAISNQDSVIQEILKECDEFTEICYYGIAHIPLVFRAGFQMGDEGNIHLYHKYRNEQSQFKEISSDADSFSITLSLSEVDTHVPTSREMLVVVATSLPIVDEDLISFQKNDLSYILYFAMKDESMYGFDSVESYGIMNRLRTGILKKTREVIVRKNIERIHLVLATSSDFTFFLAQGFSGHHDPEIVVYQYERSSEEKYPWGISNKAAPENAVFFRPTS